MPLFNIHVKEIAKYALKNTYDSTVDNRWVSFNADLESGRWLDLRGLKYEGGGGNVSILLVASFTCVKA